MNTHNRIYLLFVRIVLGVAALLLFTTLVPPNVTWAQGCNSGFCHTPSPPPGHDIFRPGEMQRLWEKYENIGRNSEPEAPPPPPRRWLDLDPEYEPEPEREEELMCSINQNMCHISEPEPEPEPEEEFMCTIDKVWCTLP